MAIILNKVSSSLEEIAFFSKCSFCKNFSDKISNELCYICHTKFNSLPKKETAIFSIKEFIFNYCVIKKDSNISWHDFLNLEESLLTISQKGINIEYNNMHFFWYFDSNSIETLINIGNILTEYFYLSESAYKSFFDKLQSNMKNFQEGMNYTYNFPCLLGKKNDIPNFDREKLKETLTEPFEFVY